VTEILPGKVKAGDDWIETNVAVWATGVSASPLGAGLSGDLDQAGRVSVENDLSVPGEKNIFVIGDMVRIEQADGSIVPGVAPAAIQMADTAAANILNDLNSKNREEFLYYDKGSMATIGRSKAIVESGKLKMTGFLAWLAWLFVHVLSLIGFRNRLWVVTEWFWAYLTRERSARLITGGLSEMESALKFISPRKRDDEIVLDPVNKENNNKTAN
jgi:NADH dehydrogenase